MIDQLLTALRTPSLSTHSPTAFELRRNDFAVLITVLAAFLLGLGVRTLALQASDRFVLGQDLPTLRYPARWLTGSPDFLHFQAINSASRSSFDAQVEVFQRDPKADETLDRARADWGLRRSQALLQYRELEATPVTVLGNTPALLVTYGYVADPLRQSGGNGLPVVVKGQDLLFFAGKKLLVVTVAADATEWAAEAHHFAIVFNSLQMKPIASTPEETSATATPGEGGDQ